MFFSNHELFATTRILVVTAWFHENSCGFNLVPRNLSWKCVWFGENSRGYDSCCFFFVGFSIIQQKNCIPRTLCTYRWIYDSALGKLQTHMNPSADRFAIWFFMYLGLDFAQSSFDFVSLRSRSSGRWLDTCVFLGCAARPRVIVV